MPKVVPSTTGHNCGDFAARITVAIWVLSPISAMKKAMTVATNAPRPGRCSLSSILSGFNVHRPMAAKLIATIQRSTLGVSWLAISAPSQPASA